MKHAKRVLAALLIAILLLLSFGSCGNSPKGETTATTLLQSTSSETSSAPISTEDTTATEAPEFATGFASTFESGTSKASSTTKAPTTTERVAPIPANFREGEIANDELRAFYMNNRAYFDLLARDFEMYWREILVVLDDYKSNVSYTAYFKNGELITEPQVYDRQISEAAEQSFKELAKQYFKAVGNNNSPYIAIMNHCVRDYVNPKIIYYYPVMLFEFFLMDGSIMLYYSPEYSGPPGLPIDYPWEHIAGDWYIDRGYV